MLCYRCGGHVKEGSSVCTSCGQVFDGRAAAFGPGLRRSRASLEGAPCAPGDVVGRYVIREHIGAGPLGWLYRAVDRTTEGDVAIKVISPRFLQLPDEKKLFLDSQKKAAKLAHPNICRVYEASEERPFVVGQYLEGLSLRRIMELRRQKGQKFSLEEIEPIVAQIAAALDAARTEFAHGNLKPENVIVLPDLLKLTDFGLAVSLPRAPFLAAQKAAGAQRYLAPEFLGPEALDPRADVYSLGVLIGELVGEEPPAAVELICRRATALRKEQRFASAGELAAELSELVASIPKAPPPQRASLEDAGDVLIVEAMTDPRLRIARALGAVSGSAPVPPPQDAPALAPPAQHAAATPASALLDSKALDVLGALPLPASMPPPPFEPAPFEPPPLPVVAVVEAAPLAAEAAPVDVHDAPTAVKRAPERPQRKGKRGKKQRAVSTPPPPVDPARAAKPRLSTPPPAAFGAIVEKPERSRAPLYGVGALGVAVLLGVAWSTFSSARPAEAAQPEVAAASVVPAPKAPVETVQTATVKPEARVVPAEPPHKTVLGDKMRSIRERAEKALAERKKKREEALAKAAARRQPAPAPQLAVAAPKAEALPPAGAIHGLDEGELLATKKERKVAMIEKPAAADFTCPSGMQKVPGGPAHVGTDASDDLRNLSDRALATVDVKSYCIDQYEFPNQPGKLPKVAAAFAEADAACRSAGKRLCSEDEWEKACRGPSEARFPYGAAFDADACNTQDATEKPRQTTVAGAFSRCKSGYGVFDMSGNAAEWTSSVFDPNAPDKAVKGGHSARPGFDDRCASRRRLGVAAHDIRVGFRCCADPQ